MINEESVKNFRNEIRVDIETNNKTLELFMTDEEKNEIERLRKVIIESQTKISNIQRTYRMRGIERINRAKEESKKTEKQKIDDQIKELQRKLDLLKLQRK